MDVFDEVNNFEQGNIIQEIMFLIIKNKLDNHTDKKIIYR